MTYQERAKEIMDIEMEGLRQARDGLGVAFSRAVRLILGQLQAGGKIVVTGVGKSLHVGQKMAATLTSTGSPATTLHPSEAMHGDFGILQPNDVLIALSYSGGSDELLTLIPVVRRQQVKIVTMTGMTRGGLADLSDEVIPVIVSREACPFNMAPTASTTAMMAIGDALAIVLLEARGFRREDYARLHPGGAIGRSLLLRVTDIMRTGERVARVPMNALVRDAVVAMTRCRSGSVAITTDDGRVAGIFTDGDLRRHLADLRDLTERPIREVMSPDPVTVRQSALAVEVLHLFEEHAIDDLIVLDDEGLLSGLVDIQDLPRLKIF